MEIYLIIILTIVVIILILQNVISFFRRNKKKNYQAGMNNAATHIYNQIKNTGKIDLILDGKKMTVIEEVAKRKKK